MSKKSVLLFKMTIARPLDSSVDYELWTGCGKLWMCEDGLIDPRLNPRRDYLTDWPIYDYEKLMPRDFHLVPGEYLTIGGRVVSSLRRVSRDRPRIVFIRDDSPHDRYAHLYVKMPKVESDGTFSGCLNYNRPLLITSLCEPGLSRAPRAFRLAPGEHKFIALEVVE